MFEVEYVVHADSVIKHQEKNGPKPLEIIGFIHRKFVPREGTNHLQIFFQLPSLMNSKFNTENYTLYWITACKRLEKIISNWFGIQTPRKEAQREEEQADRKAIGNANDMHVGNQPCRLFLLTPLPIIAFNKLWYLANTISVKILKILWNIKFGIGFLDENIHFGGSSLEDSSCHVFGLDLLNSDYPNFQLLWE